MVSAEFEAKAKKLLDRANADDHGYIGKLTDEEKDKLSQFRGMVDAHQAGNKYTDRDLCRFLRARDWVIDGKDKAFEMIKRNMEYLASQPEEDPPLESLRSAYDNGECLPWGRDKRGRQAYFHFSRNHDPANGDIVGLNVVTIMDKFVRELDPEGEVETFTVVFDLTGFSRSNRDMKFNKTIIDTLQNHHPERMGFCILLNAPTIFTIVWSIVKHWLAPRTREKIMFVGGKDYKEKIRCFFDADQLAPVLGGTSKVTPQTYITERCGPPPPGAAQKKEKHSWFGGLFGGGKGASADAHLEDDHEPSAEELAAAANEFGHEDDK
uniref:CRAL-TRIO domain-containing protein n=1 Tax=Hemiselmis andersenii TaxID=464988 RepID=A0A6U2E0M9_HEMAN